MTIGSLFSGIGGLELGLEMAGLGPVKWQVEIDEKCRNCLATHWPEAERFEDVCKVGRDELKSVDVICGGFPCQDVSSAGKRIGLSGARSGLWFEFARIVDELKPSYVVVENVASGARKYVDEVRLSLERSGYASLPVPISAADCGAWHKRQRIFIVAYRHDFKRQRSEQSGWVQSTSEPPKANEILTNSCGKRKRESNNEAHTVARDRIAREEFVCRGSLSPNINANELREQPGRRLGAGGMRAPLTKQHSGWETEPNVARVVHGFSGRVDRERALGNSVVPQCAQVIGEVINLLEALRTGARNFGE